MIKLEQTVNLDYLTNQIADTNREIDEYTRKIINLEKFNKH